MAELIVSKKKISQLLNKEGGKYVIPAYQRPYKWEKEECETLWLDLTGFYEDNKANDSEYFLGTIVTCKPENEPSSKNDEVIDGQQRVTSLLLLLRLVQEARVDRGRRQCERVEKPNRPVHLGPR